MNVWFGSICIFSGQICMSGLADLRCDNAEGYYSRGRGLACAGFFCWLLFSGINGIMDEGAVVLGLSGVLVVGVWGLSGRTLDMCGWNDDYMWDE